MKTRLRHKWNVAPKKARQIQEELRRYFREAEIDFSSVKLVAGVDAAYSKAENRVYAAATLYSYPNLVYKETHTAVRPIAFPYVPGLLTWREGPAILAVIKELSSDLDVILFDGQGYAHPRRLGIATHLGILLDKPTIGVAKTVLVGEYKQPGEEVGNKTTLMDRGERIGIVLRTRKKVAPVFISVGHRVNLEQAVKLVLDCCKGYRLPEPVRQAHLAANKIRQT